MTDEDDNTENAAAPPRTFAQTLLEQREGRTQAELTEAFAELTRAVIEHDKGGTLTLTITVNPTKMEGCVQVSDTIKTKVPEPERGASLFLRRRRRQPQPQPPAPTPASRPAPGRQPDQERMTMDETPNHGAVIRTALASAEPKLLSDDLVAMVVPEGGQVRLVDLSEHDLKYAATPKRATGTHVAATVASFADVIDRHRGDDLTIWVHPTTGSIVGVLNDHAVGQQARWGDHRVRLTLQETEAWKRWQDNDGKPLDQQSFAEQIEDGLSEIAAPAGAELLEMAQTMHGTTTVSWKAGARLHDGSIRFGYVEEGHASAGEDGSLQVPQSFTLYLSPFIDEPPRELLARLRWRNHGGQLVLSYKLDNPEQFKQNVLQGVADRLAHQFDGCVFLGEPR